MNEIDLSCTVKNGEERKKLIEQASLISYQAEKRKWLNAQPNSAESKR